MDNHSLTAKRVLLKFCFPAIIGAILLSPASARAQAGDYDTQREQAWDLLHQANFIGAQAIFEKLVAANSADGRVQFGLGYALLATSKNIKNDTERRQARIRARNALLRAKELGVQDDLLEASLATVPPDGSEIISFSNKADVDKAMQEGEAAFARGDYDKAIDAYRRALKRDPTLYLAPVFIGDMYFQKKEIEKAGEWYGRAITIDPNRETAHRYWSDVLLKNGRMKEALAEAIEAIIAEPYNRVAYQGLTQWAQMEKISLPGHPRIDIPSNVSSNKPGEVNITIDDLTLKGNDDGSSAWLMYSITRAVWMDKKDGTRSDKFAKAYPNESAYRHSLAEELDALKLVIESVQTQQKEKKAKKLTPSLENLMKLNDAGFLEAYILFAKPDRGVAQDYANYRAANRDKLRRYWSEIVVGVNN